MPLDVLGGTRATMIGSTSYSPFAEAMGNLFKADRVGDRSLQFWIFNEEFLVSAVHHTALTSSLPFVHTARRSNRQQDPVKSRDGRQIRAGNCVDRMPEPA
jgi:hypothetical protein